MIESEEAYRGGEHLAVVVIFFARCTCEPPSVVIVLVLLKIQLAILCSEGKKGRKKRSGEGTEMGCSLKRWASLSLAGGGLITQACA